MEPETLFRRMDEYPYQSASDGEAPRDALERVAAWLRILYTNDPAQRLLSVEQRRQYRIEAALDHLAYGFTPEQIAELVTQDLSEKAWTTSDRASMSRAAMSPRRKRDDALISRVAAIRQTASAKGERVPGRESIASRLGVASHRVREAIRELEAQDKEGPGR